MIPGTPEWEKAAAGAAELDAELRERAERAVAHRPATVDDDPWRQAFHVQPPVGLLNDPNGLVQHEGVYHLCYQWHPFGAQHAQKFWAHLTSSDLVHWHDQPIALAPSDPFDKDGCYSGSGIVHDGAVHFVYTGNVRGPDGSRYPYQNVAVLGEDGRVAKLAANPVLAPLPGLTAHQRDPKVWAQDGAYWMLLGAQTVDLHGTAVLLRSADLRTWEPLGPIAGGADEPFGYMWECPDLLRLEGGDVLVISPQLDHGEEAAEGRFEDISTYAVGALDLSATPPRFSGGPFEKVDAGPDFYAPQSFVDESGRTLMVAWMGMPDHDTQPDLAVKHPTAERGWVHCLTVPREVRLDGDRLVQWPVPEIDVLRREEVAHRGLTVQPGMPLALDDVSGTTLDVTLDVECPAGGSVQLRLREGLGRAVVLTLDPAQGVATLDRSELLAGEGGVFRGSFRPGPRASARVLLDSSSVEVFVDGGRLAMSARIYPEPEATGVSVRATGGAAALDLVACRLAPA